MKINTIKNRTIFSFLLSITIVLPLQAQTSITQSATKSEKKSTAVSTAQSRAQAPTSEYIIKYKDTLATAGFRSGSRPNSKFTVKSVYGRSGMVQVKVESQAELAALLANPDLEFVEPNYIITVNPIEGSDVAAAAAVANTQVRDSWALEKQPGDGPKTVVAVIDSGLDTTHPLFTESNSVWQNDIEKNGLAGVDDDSNGFIDDINGWNFAANSANNFDDNNHGTHCAGIVLSVGQDILSSQIQESKIKIMALKFLDATGVGSSSKAIAAIYYAVDNGAKVISNSWSGSATSAALEQAYKYAESKGVVIVSAAGNENKNNDVTDVYPANITLSNTISVQATNDDDTKASFSNYGFKKVTLGAPGVSIMSSVPGTTCAPLGCFKPLSGTSMATPFVAGLAALAIRENPQLTAAQAKEALMKTVDLVPVLNGTTVTGGRINALKAMTFVRLLENENKRAVPGVPTTSLDSGGSGGSGATGAIGCGLVKNSLNTPPNKTNPMQLLALLSMLAMQLLIARRLSLIKHYICINKFDMSLKAQ